MIFSVFQKLCFWVFLVQPTVVLVLLSASGFFFCIFGSGGYTKRIRRLLAGFFGIGATIYIGREMLCLPYARFLFLWMSLVFFLSVWQLSLLAAYSCWRYYIAGSLFLLALLYCWQLIFAGVTILLAAIFGWPLDSAKMAAKILNLLDSRVPLSATLGENMGHYLLWL